MAQALQAVKIAHMLVLDEIEAIKGLTKLVTYNELEKHIGFHILIQY